MSRGEIAKGNFEGGGNYELEGHIVNQTKKGEGGLGIGG